MRGFLLDLTHSLRLSRKSPGFTLLAMVCLALGIGVNTSVFSMLNYLFFRPMPVEAPDRLVMLSRDGNQLISWPEYRDLRDRSRLLTGMAASKSHRIELGFRWRNARRGSRSGLAQLSPGNRGPPIPGPLVRA
jgi:hypothetical protein